MTKAEIIRLFTFFLVAVILAGCSESAVTNEGQSPDAADIEVIQKEHLQSVFEDSRLAGFKGITENEHLQLFIDDQTGNVAVLNKASDEIWYSNPPSRDQDTIASGVNKDLLSSQLQIQFFNNFGQESSINTYSDSIAHEQYNVEPIQDGIRVIYQFGQAQRSAADLPLMLSQARFEELSGKLDSTGQRALIIAYTENSETGIYERNDGALNGLQLESALNAFDEAGYTEEDLQQDMEELNFTQEEAGSRIFIAAIEYTLDNDTLVVRIPREDIQFSEHFPVNRISLMKFFGAGDMEEQGSLFVPDGSGALIFFNNGKTRHPSYQQDMYGSDLAMVTNTDNRAKETARLPVFGVIKENEAMLAIIEEGASVSTIGADISGRLNSYNYVYPTFTVVNKDEVTIQANQQERTIPRFQEEMMNTDYTVRYAFLSGKEANYSGMARYYQKYLLENNALNDQISQHQDSPFVLQLFGSFTKQKHFAGVPYQALEALTTFTEAEEIIGKMKDKEIDNIHLNYSGWFNKGIDHKLSKNIKVDQIIGGANGFQDFLAFSKEQGVEVFPEISMLNIHNDAGLNVKKEVSRTLTSIPAAVYPFNKALNTKDRTADPAYVLSPRYVETYIKDMLGEFTSYETTGIALRDMADLLSSDFRKNNQIDRTESQASSMEALQLIQQENLNIMVNGGNAYSFPYVTDIVNAPMSNSGYKLQDESIPFYQMAVRGFLSYSGEPYNTSTILNEQEFILKTLEYGANVHFQWIYEANEIVKDTNFNHLYAVNYERWLDEAAYIYHEVNDVLKQVVNEPIVNHQMIETGVYKTEYGNGVSVMVNYNAEPVIVDGLEIAAKGYVTGGGNS
ncbi:DUF5696 domain-containing protein [Gracilibacillus alcaliphilus]|uniref:DUF5696 domain-containing protein n=1 Tax=Gracilibacillus alcaliphilus TaxID=1401441 RepID=UPI001956C89D|nr:DUF5696 domain-containing protein [Gracilibacillus alcaliphilus]MBM7677703.1 hypothetical protein [Gracilibacillus alcaliphilus]